MNAPHDIRPPRWPLQLLRFFVKKEYLEEIEGDMEELFRDRLAEVSVKRARRNYAWQALGLLRPVLMKKLAGWQPIPNMQTGMFGNYFKVSTRGLLKNPVNAFINIFGLAAAIGFCILTFGFARWTYGTDQFHEHKNEVYLSTFFAKRDGTVQEFGTAPRPLGEMLVKDFPQIKSVCRVEDRTVVMKYKDQVFHEQVRFADPTFLDMFTFPLEWGTASSLHTQNSIILSNKMAVKYFGRENPLGRQLMIKFDGTKSALFNVTGVAKPFPVSRTIDFDFLVPFDNIRLDDPAYDAHDWKSFVSATLIEVDRPADLAVIRRGMEKYRRLQNAAAPVDWAISTFSFEPLATLHERSEFIRDGISESTGDDYKSVIFLIFLGSFMLLLACLNYINIAIVSATRRLKEIGIRKSVGATRGTVLVQFLYENLITTFFALVIGLILGTFVIIPWFENINHFSMGFRLTDGLLWIYLPVIMIFTAIASGIYPSLYISKFPVVQIMKGVVQFGKKNLLTKIFLVLQLILACMFITCSVMFSRNTDFLAHRSWGYNERQTMYVSVPDGASYDKLRDLLAQDPDILAVSGSTNHLGRDEATTIVHFPNHSFEVDRLSVDANYFGTMGLQLATGRLLKDQFASDKHSLVVSEGFVEDLHLKNPLGQMLTIDSIPYRIVGTLREFHSHSFFHKMKPTIFSVAEKEHYRYLSVRARSGAQARTFRELQTGWSTLYPDIPFDGGFQDSVWGAYYETLDVHAKVWKAFACVAVLLVALGLYGLVKLNVAGRAREFSIRKVLGAGIGNIANSITRQYLILLCIALAVGVPVSYFFIRTVLDFAYSYHVAMSYSGVAVAAGILILIVLLTISTQIRKVIRANPVKGLKAE